MGFSPLDEAVVVVYLLGVTLAGSLIAGRQNNARDYFLGGKNLSWWAVGFSIVASETSTLTFISVPGLAFRSDMHFLQLVFGYFIGRLLVAWVFIPAYYRGDLETAYDLLGRRFGLPVRRLTSAVFIVTRVLSSGVRLFATAIPVHLVTGLGYAESIALIGACTIIYTYAGGLKAVVAMDVVQLVVYLSGAAASMALILHALPGGWSDVAAYATRGGTNKFEILNLSWGDSFAGFLSSPYTLAGSLLGGTFLTMASHGTDQLLVQRLLGCRSARESRKALILDASFIVVQFAFFLLLGLALFAFYGGTTYAALGLGSSDEVFPSFIVHKLPPGLAGLLVAGIFASAMGTLSSSISSLASSSYLDFYRFARKDAGGEPRREVRASRLLTLFWGAVLVGGAMLFTETRNPVVELGLRIASFTYGGLLGTFFLGLFFRGTSARDAVSGLCAGLLAMSVVIFCTTIDYTWHTLIGCIATLVIGVVSSSVFHGKNN